MPPTETSWQVRAPFESGGRAYRPGEFVTPGVLPDDDLATLEARGFVVDRMAQPPTRADVAALEERVARLEAALAARTGKEKN